MKNLEEQVKSIQLHINQKRNDLSELERESVEKIKELKEQNLFYLPDPKLSTLLGSSEPNPLGIKIRLGRKGYNHLTDYLIPVIHLVKKGVEHPDAFRRIAQTLGVAPQTVNDRCARSLSISTEKFVELIKSNRIKSFLKERFRDKADLIEREL